MSELFKGLRAVSDGLEEVLDGLGNLYLGLLSGGSFEANKDIHDTLDSFGDLHTAHAS